MVCINNYRFIKAAEGKSSEDAAADQGDDGGVDVSAGKYGTYPLIQSTDKPAIRFKKISELAQEDVDSEVGLYVGCGWHRRSKKIEISVRLLALLSTFRSTIHQSLDLADVPVVL